MYRVLHIPTGKYYWSTVRSSIVWEERFKDHTEHGMGGIRNCNYNKICFCPDDSREYVMEAKLHHFELIKVDDV